MNKVKRRDRRNCKYHYYEGNEWHPNRSEYCDSPDTIQLFCDGVCRFFKARGKVK